jgi:carbon storage regulator
MLVIRRHAGQAILVGADVEIEVIECGPHRVKLGIRAPREVAVIRREMRLTREQNRAAARTVPPMQLAGPPRLWAAGTLLQDGDGSTPGTIVRTAGDLNRELKTSGETGAKPSNG